MKEREKKKEDPPCGGCVKERREETQEKEGTRKGVKEGREDEELLLREGRKRKACAL